MLVFRWMVLPALAVIAFTGYLFFSAYRGVGFFLKKWSKAKQRILAAVITVLLLVPMRGSLFWFIVLAHFAVMLLLVDLVFAIVKKVKKKELPKSAMVLWRSGIYAVFFTAVIVGYGRYNMNHVIKTEYEVTTDKKIREDGYRLALIADLHYGISLSHEGLLEVTEEISKENPDVVVLAGDIVDERTTLEQMKDAFATLGSISSTYGVYFTYGNHDKSLYSNTPNYTVEQLEEAAVAAGITILEDMAADINSELLLIGRADRSYASDRASVAELTARKNADNMWIVLDHQPADYDEVEKAGCDMVLSGHTHAGQIWPLGLFAQMFHLDEMSYGHENRNQMDMLVTSGMAGWGIAFRTEKHSEYVIISIRPSQNVS